MNCPYCKRLVNGLTGFQEIQRFTGHLAKCRKNPNNNLLIDSDTQRKYVQPKHYQGTIEALEIRSESGQ